MRIIDFKHIHGTENRDGYIAIPELNRYTSSVSQFIELANLNITLTKPTAFLYVDGFTTSQSESGINTPKEKKFQLALRSGSSFIAHAWVHTFKNPEFVHHVNIISSTCASGIQAIYEARQLLDTGRYEEVIIIGGERITKDTVRLFKEVLVPVTCGDGFFYLRLDNDSNQISDIKWKYQYNKNPFAFSREILDTLLPGYPVDFVKLHGTGTSSNTSAEQGLSEIAQPVLYKHTIGHTQGVSSLLETCMLLEDDSVKGTGIITANGLGGFYGCFTLIKS